jgi:plasmid maintenance system killer protein
MPSTGKTETGVIETVYNLGREKIDQTISPDVGPVITKQLIFPLNLSDYEEDRTKIIFSCRDDENDVKVCFPCPQGVSFDDGASYSDFDLGILGGLGAEAVGAFSNQKEGGANIPNAIKGAMGSLFKKASGSDILNAAASSGLLPDKLAGSASFAARTVTNPRTVTNFSGNTKRSFSFSFNMIATSPEESVMVKDIHQTFRRLTYAKEDGLISLKYPPQWRIRFMLGGNESPYIPKIHNCHLTGISTSFNEESNAWRRDGAPLSVKMSLSFTEEGVMTRDQVDRLDLGDRESVQEQTRRAISDAVDEVRDRYTFDAIQGTEIPQSGLPESTANSRYGNIV